MKRFQTDDDKKYQGVFKEFLTAKGVVHEIGNPYVHHHPSMVERAHQTILSLSRTLLHDSKLPIRFYSFAMLTACHIYNRLVHGDSTQTPFEKLHGSKPDLTNLRRFGSICYAYDPLESRENGKLGSPGIKCRMIGYGEEDGIEERPGYKLFRESNGQVFYSADVIFDEETEPSQLSRNATYDDYYEDYNDQDYVDDDVEEEEALEVARNLEGDKRTGVTPHYHRSLISSDNIISGSRRRVGRS